MLRDIEKLNKLSIHDFFIYVCLCVCVPVCMNV